MKIMRLFTILCTLLLAALYSLGQATLQDAEYFWDTDPGNGNGIALVAEDGAFDEAIEYVLNSGISTPSSGGLHLFCIRFKENTGYWGPLYKRTIAIEDSVRDIKVSAAEYFWGLTDPGEGSGTAMIAFDGAFDEALETALESSITLPNTGGLHLFNVRIRDEFDNWGPLFKRVIATEDSVRDIKITAAEYFWGLTDPGTGSGIAMVVFDGAFDEALETVLDSPMTLPNTGGLQLFNVRIRDDNNSWGPLFKRAVATEDTLRDIEITAAEYFWGLTDPGEGSGTAMIAFDGAFDNALETVLDSPITTPNIGGLQLFNIRIRDDDDNWGPLYKRTIAVEDSVRDIRVTAAEYFWGLTDPGEGSATAMVAFDGAFDEALETALESGLNVPVDGGLHLFNLRVRDEFDNWGPLFKRTISTEDSARNIRITAAEYFWGLTDPGEGAGTALLAFDGAFDEALETVFTSNLFSPGIGLALFNIRIRDEDDMWGPLFKRTIVTELEPSFLVLNTTNTTDSICLGDSIQLSASGGISYSWSPSSTLSSDTLDTVWATPTATTYYVVTATNSVGNTDVDSIRVVVVVPPVDAGADMALCEGTSITLNGAGAQTYAWDNGVTDGLAFTPTATTTYTLTGTDAYGCTATDSVIVTVNALPAVTAGADTGICDGESITLSGAGAQTYTWDNSVTDGLAFTPTLTNTYVVTGTDGNGCIGSDTITIAVNSLPTVTTGADTTICDGTSITLYGAGAQTYAWDNGVTDGLPFTPGITATYIVTGTDVNGCTGTDAVTITVEPAPNVSAGNDTALCIGASITLNGSGALTYSWDNGVTDGLAFTPSTTNIYTVTGASSNGCTDTDAIIVTVNALPGVDAGLNADICDGDSITLNGTGALTYTWDNGVTDGLPFIPITTNTYTVTGTDVNGCIGSDDVTITVNTLPNVYAGADTAICNGTSIALYGSGAITYIWDNGVTNGLAFTPSLTNTYTLTGTDTIGCTNNDQVTVTINSSPTVSVTGTNPSSCSINDGTATATATAGTAPYTYSWSNGGTTAAISGLTSGNYQVTVTDGNTCTADTLITLTTSNAPTVTITSVNPSGCSANDGSASSVITGGASPFTYSWSNGNTNANITGLSAGTYSVTIYDSNGCTANASATLTSSGAPAVTINSTDPTACSINDGTVTATATGGFQPYTYSWSNAGYTSSISGLISGTFTVTVSDINGCTATASTSLNASGAPSVTGSGNNPSNCSTNDGTATVNVTGGIAPYTYSWNTGSTDSTLNGLSSGSYIVTVSDAAGCMAGASVNLNAAGAPSITTIPTNPTACSNNNGSITTNIVGGIMPYTYSWSNGNTSANINSLTAGTYSVTVSDANGCMASTSRTLTASASPDLTASGTDPSTCNANDGTATAIASNGIAPYTYSWSNGSSNASLNGLASGTYSVSVTDANGCMSSAALTLTSLGSPTLSVSGTAPTTCNGNDGTATANVTGGVFPYTYTWSNGNSNGSISGLSSGTYSVTVSDGNSCMAAASITLTGLGSPTVSANTTDPTNCSANDGTATAIATDGLAPYTYSWSNGSTSSSISGLTAGTYSLSVTDANSCIANVSLSLFAVGAPNISTSTTNPTTCSASNGIASAATTGGTAPYTYSWSTGDSSSYINGLSAGTYSVTVTDSSGCMASTSVSLTAPGVPSVTATGTDPTTCSNNDGAAIATATGGTSPYTYSWSNGATTAVINGLISGTYTVTVSDANACMASVSTTLNASGAPSVTANGIDPTACGANDGAATANVTGGTAPYTYSWSNGGTSTSITGLGGGSYSVTVSDGSGCMANATTTLTAAGTPVLTASGTNPTSCNASDGVASANVTGGTAPYTYSWSNGGNTATINGLSTGTYTINVTDANSCVVSGSVIIAASGAPTITATGTNPTTCSANDGAITSSTSGGLPPYTYSWSNGANTASINGLYSGVYTVTVSDANTCMATASVNLTNVTGGPSVSTFGTDPTSCNTNDGYASANASAGAPPYTYSWSNGGNTAAINGLNAGTFTVTVSDANACITTGSVILNSTGAPAVTAIGTNPTSCSTSDGMATANVSAGTAPYTYSWSNGSSNPAINGLTSGTYTLTVTDANACMTSVIITLSASGAPSLVMTGTDLTCYGDNSGTATSTVSSGLAPYSYLWSNGGTGSMLSGLSGGIYSLTITDANGCLVSGSSSIAEPTEILTSIAATDANCSGASDGAADLSVSGGTPPYGYSWSDGSTTEDLSGIAAGTYTVDVTDNNGCTMADVATINEISSGPQTGIILGATQVSASSQEQYAVSQNIGYSYSWTVSGGIILSGQGSNIIQVQWGNAGSGQVAIVETDSAGCTGDTVTLAVVIGAGTSIIMNPGSSDMIIYPNPFNQSAKVVFSNEARATYELVLYDMLGKKVRRLENISSNEVLINKGLLSPGMYFLELQGIAKTFRGRIIVE